MEGSENTDTLVEILRLIETKTWNRTDSDELVLIDCLVALQRKARGITTLSKTTALCNLNGSGWSTTDSLTDELVDRSRLNRRRLGQHSNIVSQLLRASEQ